MKTLFVIIALALAAPATAQQVYRWVDENGVVHYSDIRPAQSYESMHEGNPQGFDPAAQAEAGEEGLSYMTIRIVAPPDGEAIWATGGVYTIQVETVPALQPGDRISLWLNGSELPGMPVASTSIGITGLIRGEHTLQAAVVGPEGQMRIFSTDISFHVLQASSNQPQRRRSAP
ncbi:MAG: DUF4124 domain-containing protein [Xanthomonadaceae bacterium]|nr:DUF4124 domain-containing protein [Xanthomonadaceae bacterium]